NEALSLESRHQPGDCLIANLSTLFLAVRTQNGPTFRKVSADLLNIVAMSAVPAAGSMPISQPDPENIGIDRQISLRKMQRLSRPDSVLARHEPTGRQQPLYFLRERPLENRPEVLRVGNNACPVIKRQAVTFMPKAHARRAGHKTRIPLFVEQHIPS